MDDTASGDEAGLPRRRPILEAVDTLAALIRAAGDDPDAGPDIVYASCAVEAIAAAIRKASAAGQLTADAITAIDQRGYLRGRARGFEDGRLEGWREGREALLRELAATTPIPLPRSGRLRAVADGTAG